MRTNTRGRGPLGAIAALALLLGLPALAQAQLFPNQTIHRQRVACCEENPIYGIYRRQYYGYYPTCWRRFPAGWGCPGPEAPNSLAAMEEIRKEIEKQAAEDANVPNGAEPEDDMTAPPADRDRNRPRVPELPEDLDNPFATPPPGRQAEPPGALPPPDGPRAELELSPLPDAPAPIEAQLGSALSRRSPAPAGPDATAPMDGRLLAPARPIQSPAFPDTTFPGPAIEEPLPPITDGMGALPQQARRRSSVIGGMFENLRNRRRR